MRRQIFTLTILTAVALGGCGKKKSSDSTTPLTPIDDPTVSSSTIPASPTAADLLSNPASQSQVVSSALGTGTSSAAAGTAASGSATTFMAEENDFADTVTQPTETVARGERLQKCYAGKDLTSRAASATPTWPEATDTSSPFAASKTDATTATQMYVEPALLQYPATSPTATLTLSAPFAFANLAEIIETDARVTNIHLADKRQTSVTQTANYEEHRFWVAQHQKTGKAAAFLPIACIGSGNIEHAQINWGDDTAGGRVDGLNLLARFKRVGTQAKTFYPKVKGEISTTASQINTNFTATGAHLVQWSIPAAAASTDVTGATIVVEKQVTRSATRVDEILDTDAATVKSTLTATDEIRATAPLVIREYRDATEVPLAHVIVSGTVYKTNAKWFTTFAYAGVKFDYGNSTEVCIPVSGTLTMTVYDKEGGTAQGDPVVITYSSADSTIVSGKVDPSIAVSGDDTDGTRAQWMMLAADRKCDLNDLKK